ELHAHRPLVHELGRVQEALEQVEVAPQLPAVARALGAGVLGAADLAPHGDLREWADEEGSSKHVRSADGSTGRWPERPAAPAAGTARAPLSGPARHASARRAA